MKIFIDAGHNDSGWNTGATGNGLREQDVTFNVAKKLGDILATKGLTVRLSRPAKETILGTDNNSAINARWSLANEWSADYFLSIHCNAGGGTGTETYYYRDDSKTYAQVIQDTFVAEMGLGDRGIKYGTFAVIRYTTMQAILIELAFIDTSADADILRNRQDDMASALARGFIRLLGLSEEEDEMRYQTIEEIKKDLPWAAETIQKLIDKGYLKSLDLSKDMIRVFVVNDEAGIYDLSK